MVPASLLHRVTTCGFGPVASPIFTLVEHVDVEHVVLSSRSFSVGGRQFSQRAAR